MGSMLSRVASVLSGLPAGRPGLLPPKWLDDSQRLDWQQFVESYPGVTNYGQLIAMFKRHLAKSGKTMKVKPGQKAASEAFE